MITQEIKTAFGDMPYPGTERIVNDLQGYDLERKQIKEEFSRYENWQDVPRELLLQERDALPLFEPQGFRLKAFGYCCPERLPSGHGKGENRPFGVTDWQRCYMGLRV